MGTWSDWKKLGGDPNLQYDETTNYIQIKDVDGNWHNLKYAPSVPIPNGLNNYYSNHIFLT